MSQEKTVLYGYCRLSRDEDKENYTSIISQQNIINNWCVENFNRKVDKFYIDDNYSGYSFNRPEFTSLTKELNNNEVNHIIISKDLSRIGRHNAKVLLFIEDIKNKGKRIILIDDNYDTITDEDDIIGIKTWYNERYVKDISKKIKSNIKSMQKEGKFVCAVPYGYKLHPTIKHKVIVDEENAKYVQEMFKLYIEGYGFRKIAAHLTNKNVPTPSMIDQQEKQQKGKTYKKSVTNVWSTKMIWRIIANDFYIGTLRQGKYKILGINGIPVKNNEDEQFVFYNNHTPLISENDFKLAQEISKKRSTSTYRGSCKHKNLFSGFLFCEDCGSFMVALNKEGKNKSYICGSYNQRGKTACSTHYVLDIKLITILKTTLQLIRDNLKDIILEYNKTVEDSIKQNENFNGAIFRLEKEIDIFNQELKILIGQKIKDIMKNPTQEEIISQTYEELIIEKQNKITILKDELSDLIKHKEQIGEFENNSRSALQVFDDIINKEITKKDLELIIDKIIINKKGIPTFKFKKNIDELINQNHSVDQTRSVWTNNVPLEKVISIVNWANEIKEAIVAA